LEVVFPVGFGIVEIDSFVELATFKKGFVYLFDRIPFHSFQPSS
jgi:hypothetical protein